MKTGTLLRTIASAICLLAPLYAYSGERDGVLRALDGLPSSWPDAAAAVSIEGATGTELALGRSIQFKYRTAVPAYATLVDVTSHGDMTLMRAGVDQSRPALEGSTVTFNVTPPLGTETVYFIFSKQPLDSLFKGAQSSRPIGDRTAEAADFVQQVRKLAASTSVTMQRVQYQVVGQPGQTEQTTRGIIREMTALSTESTGGSHPAVASFPTHIQFEFGSDRILPEGRLALDVFGELLARPGANSLPLRLEGHTDDVGSESYNQELSVRRAQSAKNYIVSSFGIESARITVVGFGKSRPLTPNIDDASRAQNRRVDFILPAVPLKDP